MTTTIRLMQTLAATVLLAVCLTGPARALEAGVSGTVDLGAPVVEAPEASTGEMEFAQNGGGQVRLETVIAQLRGRCGGQVVNARYDSGSNQYVIRWETRNNRIVSIRVDASTGRIVSGSC